MRTFTLMFSIILFLSVVAASAFSLCRNIAETWPDQSGNFTVYQASLFGFVIIMSFIYMFCNIMITLNFVNILVDTPYSKATPFVSGMRQFAFFLAIYVGAEIGFEVMNLILGVDIESFAEKLTVYLGVGLVLDKILQILPAKIQDAANK